MNIDYDKRVISFENCLIFKNSDTGIKIKGNSLGVMAISFKELRLIGRTNKSKIITKFKWIIEILKYKL